MKCFEVKHSRGELEGQVPNRTEAMTHLAKHQRKALCHVRSWVETFRKFITVSFTFKSFSFSVVIFLGYHSLRGGWFCVVKDGTFHQNPLKIFW